MEVGQMNPCKNCTRVPIPELCNNKLCQDWQAYFAPAWDAACLRLIRALLGKGEQNDLRRNEDQAGVAL